MLINHARRNDRRERIPGLVAGCLEPVGRSVDHWSRPRCYKTVEPWLARARFALEPQSWAICAPPLRCCRQALKQRSAECASPVTQRPRALEPARRRLRPGPRQASVHPSRGAPEHTHRGGTVRRRRSIRRIAGLPMRREGTWPKSPPPAWSGEPRSDPSRHSRSLRAAGAHATRPGSRTRQRLQRSGKLRKPSWPGLRPSPARLYRLKQRQIQAGARFLANDPLRPKREGCHSSAHCWTKCKAKLKSLVQCRLPDIRALNVPRHSS